jgi:hypothetical protein
MLLPAASCCLGARLLTCTASSPCSSEAGHAPQRPEAGERPRAARTGLSCRSTAQADANNPPRVSCDCLARALMLHMLPRCNTHRACALQVCGGRHLACYLGVAILGSVQGGGDLMVQVRHCARLSVQADYVQEAIAAAEELAARTTVRDFSTSATATRSSLHFHALG